MIVKLSELFYSIQGEGPAIGRPAIVIRLSKCNLDCIGCDSPIRNKVEETEPISVINRVKNYLKTYPNSRIIFTGGEPLLQQQAILDIMNGLPGQTFDLETNGTLDIGIELLNRFNIIVVSPKKNYFDTLKDSSAFLRKWFDLSNDNHHNVFFKIVVGSLPWAWSESEVRIVLERSGIPTNRVWLMPAGDDNNKLLISSRNCWKVAMRLGCNYSDRLHIRTGGK